MINLRFFSLLFPSFLLYLKRFESILVPGCFLTKVSGP